MVSRLHKVIVITWVLPFSVISVMASAATCGLGWFGPQCQYKCHCTKDLCTTDGECLSGSHCESGWFGRACQYVDLAQYGQVTLNPNFLCEFATDGDDRTCVKNVASIQLNWETPYTYTWLRITGLYDGWNPNFVVTLKDSNLRPLRCTNQRIKWPSTVTADIFCEINVTIREMSLKGTWGKTIDVCSFYVSGEPICKNGMYGLNCSSRYIDLSTTLNTSSNETLGHTISSMSDQSKIFDSTSVPVDYVYIAGGVGGAVCLLLIVILVLVLTLSRSRPPNSDNTATNYCSYNHNVLDNHEYLISTGPGTQHNEQPSGERHVYAELI